MAGSNLALKDGQVLFKQGEEANGMYLVRKGELLVFMEKEGHEVKLAKISSGGMIGEMAFFDKKPRSASVRASTPGTEVTLITPDDFSKLMKQIPKWFVSIMASLSTRLRETNERLQVIEAKAAGVKAPYEDLVKVLNVLSLIWAKESTKEGKGYALPRQATEAQISAILGALPDWVKVFTSTFSEEKFFSTGVDSYKKETLILNNKGALGEFATFIQTFMKLGLKQTSLSDSAIALMAKLVEVTDASAYDNAAVTLEQIAPAGDEASIPLAQSWKSELEVIVKASGPALQLSKVSNGHGVKVDKKELPKVLQFHRLLAACAKAKLY